MDKREVGMLIVAASAIWPNSKALIQDERALVDGWHLVLADTPYALAERALAQWARTEQWSPHPSELRTMVAAELMGLPEPDEAWAIARSAVATFYPGHKNDIAIPDAIRRAIKAIGGLYQLKISETPAKDRDAFIRAYTTERKREMQTAVLDRIALEAGGSDDDDPRLGQSNMTQLRPPVPERTA